MKLSTLADVNVIAVGVDQTISIMLDVTAAHQLQDEARMPQSIQVVLDRSGSMGGQRLESARHALTELVGRLDSQDRFGLVVFDTNADVVIPNLPMSQHNVGHLHDLISQIVPGGSTDISAGYLLGLSEIKRTLPQSGGTLVLMSDGQANAGVRDPSAFGGLAATAVESRVTSTTIGIGAGYNEVLLEAIATSGDGNHCYAEHDDSAIALLAAQVDGLLTKMAMNTLVRLQSLTGQPAGEFVNVLARGAIWPEGNDLVIRLGDLYSDESRRIIVDAAIPVGRTSHTGTLNVLDIVVEYVALPALDAHTITSTVTVDISDNAHDVVVINEQVRIERLLALTQNAKRSAMDKLYADDVDAAVAEMEISRTLLQETAESLDSQLDDKTRSRVSEEIADLAEIETRMRNQTAEQSAKYAMGDWNRKSRGRGKDLNREIN
jgi:Ca-activated chloride channel family protein